MAADWVGYLKDAQRRNPAGPRVQFWEMGNELYGKGEGPAVTLTPEAYVGKLRAFVPAMRAADPAIRVGAIGMENYPTFPFNAYPRWNETVLKQAGELIDYFAVHNAYAPVGVPDRADPRDVYRALWAAPLMVAENLRTVAGQIRRFAPPGSAERIRIAVTEWAPLFHVSPSSAWVDHSKTLGSALYVADILRVFIQNDSVDAAAFFKLNEPSFLGLMGARQGRWIPNASYHAFQLYTRHFGDKVVRSRSQAPTYDSVKAGIVPAMKAVPLLESVASLSADGETLFVMLINKSIDRRADVSLEVAGFDAAGAVAHLLTGASPDSNTGTELPRVPGIRWARQVNVDERARHLDRGSPREVSFTSAPLAGTGGPMSYSVPPHSVASLELRRPVREISREALARLEAYAWPGNVRELRNVVRRAVLEAEAHVIEPAQVAAYIEEGSADLAQTRSLGERSLKEIADDAAKAAERHAIIETLRGTAGNKSQAARALRTDYKTLHLKMKSLGINARDYEQS